MKRMMIRIFGAIAALLITASASSSAVRIVTEERTYPVSGKTGPELYASMLKKAPRRSIFTQDIAQYSYKFTVRHNFRINAGTCFVQGATAYIRIVATYPRAVDKLSPRVRGIWSRNVANMRRVQEARTRIARQVTEDLMKSTAGLKAANDPTCTKIRRPLNRLARQAYAHNDALQDRFDKESELSISGWKLLQELRGAK